MYQGIWGNIIERKVSIELSNQSDIDTIDTTD